MHLIVCLSQAYGVKIEILVKLSTIKSNALPPITADTPSDALSATCGNTMMHYLAWEANKYHPEVIGFSENWEAVWAAADVSYKQVSYF